MRSAAAAKKTLSRPLDTQAKPKNKYGDERFVCAVTVLRSYHVAMETELFPQQSGLALIGYSRLI